MIRVWLTERNFNNYCEGNRRQKISYVQVQDLYKRFFFYTLSYICGLIIKLYINIFYQPKRKYVNKCNAITCDIYSVLLLPIYNVIK